MRSFAAEFNQRNLPLNFLINNAGSYTLTSVEYWWITCCSNWRTHWIDNRWIRDYNWGESFRVCNDTSIDPLSVGCRHFLLTNLLLENLKASAPSRIITVSSDAHNGVEEVNFATFKEPTTAFNSTGMISEYLYLVLNMFIEAMYKQSKLCNILFSNYLASLLEGTGVTSNAVHPGLISSGFFHGVNSLSD